MPLLFHNGLYAKISSGIVHYYSAEYQPYAIRMILDTIRGSPALLPFLVASIPVITPTTPKINGYITRDSKAESILPSAK